MSQTEVYTILVEFGGSATSSEIRDAAKNKFPNLTLHTYVTNRLRKLEKNGYVISDTVGNSIVWTITNLKFP